MKFELKAQTTCVDVSIDTGSSYFKFLGMALILINREASRAMSVAGCLYRKQNPAMISDFCV
jgi:hypothetical protein